MAQETNGGNRWWVTLAGALVVAVATGFITQIINLSALSTSVLDIKRELNEVAKKQDEVQIKLAAAVATGEYAANDRYTGAEAAVVAAHFNRVIDRLSVRVERVEAACTDRRRTETVP